MRKLKKQGEASSKHEIGEIGPIKADGGANVAIINGEGHLDQSRRENIFLKIKKIKIGKIFGFGCFVLSVGSISIYYKVVYLPTKAKEAFDRLHKEGRLIEDVFPKAMLIEATANPDGNSSSSQTASEKLFAYTEDQDVIDFYGATERYGLIKTHAFDLAARSELAKLEDEFGFQEGSLKQRSDQSKQLIDICGKGIELAHNIQDYRCEQDLRRVLAEVNVMEGNLQVARENWSKSGEAAENSTTQLLARQFRLLFPKPGATKTTFHSFLGDCTVPAIDDKTLERGTNRTKELQRADLQFLDAEIKLCEREHLTSEPERRGCLDDGLKAAVSAAEIYHSIGMLDSMAHALEFASDTLSRVKTANLSELKNCLQWSNSALDALNKSIDNSPNDPNKMATMIASSREKALVRLCGIRSKFRIAKGYFKLGLGEKLTDADRARYLREAQTEKARLLADRNIPDHVRKLIEDVDKPLLASLP